MQWRIIDFLYSCIEKYDVEIRGKYRTKSLYLCYCLEHIIDKLIYQLKY